MSGKNELESGVAAAFQSELQTDVEAKRSESNSAYAMFLAALVAGWIFVVAGLGFAISAFKTKQIGLIIGLMFMLAAGNLLLGAYYPLSDRFDEKHQQLQDAEQALSEAS